MEMYDSLISPINLVGRYFHTQKMADFLRQTNNSHRPRASKPTHPAWMAQKCLLILVFGMLATGLEAQSGSVPFVKFRLQVCAVSGVAPTCSGGDLFANSVGQIHELMVVKSPSCGTSPPVHFSCDLLEVEIAPKTIDCGPDMPFYLSKSGKNSISYSIIPKKNNSPLNAISTFDLVRLLKHNHGAIPFTSPYQYVAADINKNGVVTTFDIYELRKLILGIYNDFPANESWRFIRSDYNWPNPPLDDFLNIPESIAFDLPSNTAESLDFIGVKIGDLTGDAECNNRPAELLTGFSFDIARQRGEKGDIIVVPIVANCKENMVGFQAGLRFDPTVVEYLSVSKGDLEGITPGCFNMKNTANGEIKMVWVAPDFDNFVLENGQTVCYLAFKILKGMKAPAEIVKLDESLLRCEGYGYTDKIYSISAALPAALQTPIADERAVKPAAKPAVMSPVCLPNPSSGSTTIRWEMPQAGKATVWVFGPFGVRVFYRELGILAAGQHELLLEGAESWSSGLYTCRVITDFADERAMLIKQ